MFHCLTRSWNIYQTLAEGTRWGCLPQEPVLEPPGVWGDTGCRVWPLGAGLLCWPPCYLSDHRLLPLLGRQGGHQTPPQPGDNWTPMLAGLGCLATAPVTSVRVFGWEPYVPWGTFLALGLMCQSRLWIGVLV